MKYILHPMSIEYEIPDEWLVESEANKYKPTSNTYKASSNIEYPTTIITFNDALAPIRDPEVRWFKKERMVSILKGIVSGAQLPPIEIHKETKESKYIIKDGFHRFYASAALGFNSLPVSVRPYFDINAL